MIYDIWTVVHEIILSYMSTSNFGYQKVITVTIDLKSINSIAVSIIVFCLIFVLLCCVPSRVILPNLK